MVRLTTVKTLEEDEGSSTYGSVLLLAGCGLGVGSKVLSCSENELRKIRMKISLTRSGVEEETVQFHEKWTEAFRKKISAVQDCR